MCSTFTSRHVIQRLSDFNPEAEAGLDQKTEGISNRKFLTWPNWWRKQRKIKLLRYIWRKTHKSHCLWSRGEIRSDVVWLNLPNNFIHLAFISALPFPPKSLCRNGFLISHWRQEGGCSQAILKAVHHSPGHWPRACSKDSVGHIGCACHFSFSSHCTSSH